MNKLYIPILLGTTRIKRKSGQVANLIHEFGAQLENVRTEVIDPVEFTFHGDGNDSEAKDPNYTKITKAADAFIIVVPEYNHSFPGSLKRMLDSESKNYIHKPVAFAGVSSGGWGGVRAIESLVNVVRELGLTASFTDIHFPRVQDLFDEEGKIVDPGLYQSRLESFYNELIWLAKTLRYGRDNITNT